ncbi:MAG: BatA and WFA domain-containing protein [bacterium]|nr:BatA and WFA domain-containing protein [bacterium]
MTWLYPLFLWALIALLIPIIIHLFNFRRYKKIAFTNLRFLKQINQQTKSGNQLKKYLILASRLLALTFLIFAFAQPIKLTNNKAINRSKQLISIIIDNSYSMNNTGAEGLFLEAAKNRARAIISNAKNSDEFQIITSDMNAALMHNSSKQTAMENIDQIKTGAGSHPLAQLILLQERLLNKSNDLKNAFIISDFQKNDPPVTGTPIDTAIQKTWIRLANNEAANICIDTCYLNAPILQIGETISLNVQVANYSPNEIQGLTIDLLIDNKPKGVASFDIQPFAKTSQTFNFILEEGGSHACVLKHAGDNMAFDDQLFFSLNLKTDYKVINIYDKKEQYINAVFNETKGFSYQGFSSGTVQFNTFNNASLICVEGSNNLSNGMADELKKYVTKGGNLFLFPQANIPFGSLQNIASAVGFTIDENPVTLNGKVASFDLEHPIFKNLFEKIPKQLDLPLVSRYFAINKPSSIALMKLNNGSSFLSNFKMDKGQVYLCSSPLNSEYTNFQNHAFFVPVLLKSAMLLQYESPLYFECGQTENIATGQPFTSERGITLQMDNNRYVTEVINMNGSLFLNTNGEIGQAGNYKALLSNTDSSLLELSFNTNRNESDTRTFSESELESLATENGSQLFSGSAEKLSAEYAAALKGTPLWKWCIIFVLFFLMIEILLIRFLKPHAKLST